MLHGKTDNLPGEIPVTQFGRGQNRLRHVMDVEWPLQKRGPVPVGPNESLNEFLGLLATFEPANVSQQILHAETIREFNALIDLRRTRLHMASVSIPGIMWYTVVTGAILCLVLIWLFDSSLTSQLLLGGVSAFGISTMICLSALMDNPFRGELSVSPAVFEAVYVALVKT